MARITKEKSKLHDQAMDLIFGTDRNLKWDELWFCFNNYNPMAEHNVSKGAIFFTPEGICEQFATAVGGVGGKLIDLCAGIGKLSAYVMAHNGVGWYGSRTMQFHGDLESVTCVENNPEFVKVGKRLLPQADWVEGSVFDAELMASLGEFNVAISNPPYGNIPSVKQANWTRTTGGAEWRVMEVACRMCWNGGKMIVPKIVSDYDLEKREYRKEKEGDKYIRKAWEHVGNIALNPWAVDLREYQRDWEGMTVAPDLYIVDVGLDDIDWDKRPFGWTDVVKKEQDAERKKRIAAEKASQQSMF